MGGVKLKQEGATKRRAKHVLEEESDWPTLNETTFFKGHFLWAHYHMDM